MSLAAVFLLAALVVATCALGGFGGYRFGARMLRRELLELGDDVAALERRISRREGEAGAEKKRRERTREEEARDELSRMAAAQPAVPPAAPAVSAADQRTALVLAAKSRRLNGAGPIGRGEG